MGSGVRGVLGQVRPTRGLVGSGPVAGPGSDTWDTLRGRGCAADAAVPDGQHRPRAMVGPDWGQRNRRRRRRAAPPKIIDSLRGVFQPAGVTRTARTWLDGRRVLVVDEVYNTGDTLRIAQGLFQRAFPEADIRGDHWMTPGTKIDRAGNRRTAEVPVWYRADTWTGRLVGNRMDPDNPPTTVRNRSGALFLSTRPRSPDTAGRQLRAEVTQLAADLMGARLLARPASSRSREDQKERIRVLFGFDEPKDFLAARQTQDGNDA